MPSFAKKTMDDSATEVQEIRMSDTFEGGRAVEVLQKTKQQARRRAKDIIQQQLPEYIEHLSDLLEKADQDETSPFWKGHLESEKFAAENTNLVAPGGVSAPNDHAVMATRDGPFRAFDLCICSNGSIGCRSETVGFEKLQIAKEEGSEVHLEEASQLPLGRCWQHKVSPNETCDRVMKLVQVEGERGLSMALILRRWGRLEVPTVEDGGNFGVGVQKQCLNNIDVFLTEANTAHRYGQEKYYPTRTNMERAWCQYPNIKDHAAAIATIDRNAFSGARIELEDLLTGATYILSHLRKNWAKVHDPKNKGDNEEADVLY